MPSPKCIQVIAGPTASGKTAAAIQLAQELNCPIVNADSRQVYAEMAIGTARPSSAELQLAEHQLFGCISIHSPLSAGEYARLASTYINKHFESHDNLILCGGSGLYIQALLYGFNEIPAVDPHFREELNAEFTEYGIEPLQKELQTSDPQYYKQVDIQNHQRIIRALEVIRAHKIPFSNYRNQPTQGIGYPFSIQYIEPERGQLYDRIDARVLDMIELGLEEEVRALYPYKHLQALNTVGYSEWWPFFEGECSLDEVIMNIQQHTRNYAKRQVTWFKKYLHK